MSVMKKLRIILIVIVSSVTKEPSKDMLATFDEVAAVAKN